jgi:hypothetical protein
MPLSLCQILIAGVDTQLLKNWELGKLNF